MVRLSVLTDVTMGARAGRIITLLAVCLPHGAGLTAVFAGNRSYAKHCRSGGTSSQEDRITGQCDKYLLMRLSWLWKPKSGARPHE